MGSYAFSLEQPIPEAGGTQFQTAHLQIELTAEGDQVTGTISGPTTQTLTQPSCPSTTVEEGWTEAEVEGTLTDEELSLRVVSASWRPPSVEPCPQGGTPGLIGETTESGIEGFDESLLLLRGAGDDSYRFDHTETIEAHSPFTVEYHIEVHFDQ
jgi:hypothetical protein